MIFRFPVILCIVLLALVSQACNTSAPNPQDVIDVRKTLTKRAIAIKEKDIEAYRSVFYPEYFDGKYHLDDLVNEMAAMFEKYESIEFTAQKAPVETKMNSARVVQRVIYDIEGRENSIQGREILALRRVDGKWLISGGVFTGLD